MYSASAGYSGYRYIILMLYGIHRHLFMPESDPMTWSSITTELIENKVVGLRPYDLKLIWMIGQCVCEYKNFYNVSVSDLPR